MKIIEIHEQKKRPRMIAAFCLSSTTSRLQLNGLGGDEIDLKSDASLRR